jgi:outer membrane protein assembly factor BamB
VWRSNRYQVRETVGISEDGHRVYARCMTDTVVALLTSSSSLSVLWATPCGYGYDIDPSMPIEKHGVVFFGTKNGLVIALDAKTGNVLWKHRVGETIVHTPVPLEARCVLVSDLDGRLSLIQAR